jgi:hypothetical protein
MLAHSNGKDTPYEEELSTADKCLSWDLEVDAAIIIGLGRGWNI